MRKPFTFIIPLACLALLLIASCEPITSAQMVTSLTLIPTVQIDQYLRDARATQTVREATVASNAVEIMRTAEAATYEAQRAEAANRGTATMEAYQAARLEAEAQWTQRAVDTQVMQEQTQRAVVAGNQTATVVVGIARTTETAVVESTQTSQRMAQAQAESDMRVLREQAYTGLGILLTCLLIYLGYRVGRQLTLRAAMMHYGPNKNPWVMLEKGNGVYAVNPLDGSVLRLEKGDWYGANVTPDQAFDLKKGAQQLLVIQAQHSPHPEPMAKRVTSEVRLGAWGSRSEKVSSPPVSVAPVAPPAIATPTAAPALEKTAGVHWGFIEANTTEADRDLLDVREFLERGALVGFSRADWLNYQFKSGHTCGKDRYNKMIDVLKTAQVVERKSGRLMLTVKASEAIARLNLEGYELNPAPLPSG